MPTTIAGATGIDKVVDNSILPLVDIETTGVREARHKALEVIRGA